MSRYIDSNDPRVVANADGSYAIPGGHDSWTIRQEDGQWRARADHGEYANPPYQAGATADEVIGKLIGQPLTPRQYFAGEGLTERQRRLLDEVTGRAGVDGSDTQNHLDAADAAPLDKAAVAEVLGGPGEGDRYANPASYGQRRATEIAEKIEQALRELEAEAADPAGTLVARGWPTDTADEFGARKQAAVTAAREYAAKLREQAANAQPMTAAEIAQAEKVALAAQMGGILTDGRRWADPTHQSPWASQAEREATAKYYQDKTAAIEGSGAFTHIAQNGQAPFWQLGHVDQAQDDNTTGRDEATANHDQREEHVSSNDDDSVNVDSLNFGFPGGGFTGPAGGTCGGSTSNVFNGSFTAAAVSYGDGAEVIGNLTVNAAGTASSRQRQDEPMDNSSNAAQSGVSTGTASQTPTGDIRGWNVRGAYNSDVGYVGRTSEDPNPRFRSAARHFEDYAEA